MSTTAKPDRRDVIIGGAAVLGATVVPKAFAAAPGLAPAGDLLGATRAFLGKAHARPAQGGLVCLGRRGMAALELFRRRRLHQAGPSPRADERRPEGRRLGPARDGAVAGRAAEGEDRHAAAGRAGRHGHRRRAAHLAAVLVRGLRHAGRDRRVGLPPRRAPSASLVRGARRPDRVGHAGLVLVQSQPRHVRRACRPGDAARRRRRWRGGSSATSRRRVSRRRASRRSRSATSCPMRDASAPMPRRSASPPPT